MMPSDDVSSEHLRQSQSRHIQPSGAPPRPSAARDSDEYMMHAARLYRRTLCCTYLFCGTKSTVIFRVVQNECC
eukprot:scaffold83872_cov18-Prasinocladus_malaysianus.AAC.3